MKIYDPGLVVIAMRSWLRAQATPDPEAGETPPAYQRCLDHLDELIATWMQDARLDP